LLDDDKPEFEGEKKEEKKNLSALHETYFESENIVCGRRIKGTGNRPFDPNSRRAVYLAVCFSDHNLTNLPGVFIARTIS